METLVPKKKRLADPPTERETRRSKRGLAGPSTEVVQIISEEEKERYKIRSNLNLVKSLRSLLALKIYKAFHYVNKALAYNTENVLARVTRGTVYSYLGMTSEALKDTEESLRLDPQNEFARRQMAEQLIATSKTPLLKGDYKKFREILHKAKEYNLHNRELQELLEKANGLIYYATSEDSKEVFKKLVFKDVAHIYERNAPVMEKTLLWKQYDKALKRLLRPRKRNKGSDIKKSKDKKPEDENFYSYLFLSPPRGFTKGRLLRKVGTPIFQRYF